MLPGARIPFPRTSEREPLAIRFARLDVSFAPALLRTRCRKHCPKSGWTHQIHVHNLNSDAAGDNLEAADNKKKGCGFH